MAIRIQVLEDTIKIDKAFVSGKDRVAVNDQVVFEGKLPPNTPLAFAVGNREYSFETRVVSRMTNALAIHLEIRETAELVHAGVYDQTGKRVNGDGGAKSTGAIQTCGMIGGLLGFAAMMYLGPAAVGGVAGDAVAGGIRGGIGGIVGYGLGFGFGSMIFGSK